MARSLKKGPFVAPSLLKKVKRQKETGKKSVIETYARGSVVLPKFVGLTIAIHNGRKFLPVYITENMIGHKLGEFSPTRTFRGHVSKGRKK